MSGAFEPAQDWASACQCLEIARRDCLESGDSDEEIMLYGGAQCEAGYALLLTLAPDAAALAHKLTVFRDEETYRLDTPAVREFLEALIADVERLAGNGQLNPRPASD